MKFTGREEEKKVQYSSDSHCKQYIFIKRTRTKKQIFIAIIAANRIKDNLYSDDLISGVVTLDDFF